MRVALKDALGADRDCAGAAGARYDGRGIAARHHVERAATLAYRAPEKQQHGGASMDPAECTGGSGRGSGTRVPDPRPASDQRRTAVPRQLHTLRGGSCSIQGPHRLGLSLVGFGSSPRVHTLRGAAVTARANLCVVHLSRNRRVVLKRPARSRAVLRRAPRAERKQLQPECRGRNLGRPAPRLGRRLEVGGVRAGQRGASLHGADGRRLAGPATAKPL